MIMKRLTFIAILALPLAAHAQTLQQQLDGVRQATAKYQDWQKAVDDGYVLFGKEGPLMGEHWYRRDLVDQPFDIAHPSTLQYANINGKKVLVGVAYTVYRKPGDAMPAGFVGDDDHWHVHDITKLADAMTRNRPLAHAIVQRRIENGTLGPDGKTQLTMLHAWVWLENPAGVFTLEHTGLPYLRAGLPVELAHHADEFAPWGVTLLDARGCPWELGKVRTLAETSNEQQARLREACVTAANEVRAAPRDERINAVASRAWQGYLHARDAILTEQQKVALNSTMEPMEPSHAGHMH